ncbi:MAG TPA: delta-60 repeat domain-containing protein, partial [Actinomycetota bacterium]
GALDASFSEDGRLTTTFSIGYDVAQAVAIQADGRLVVAGFTAAGDGQFAVARYHRDGSLDAAFGGDGKVTTDFSSLDHANDVDVQADGAIVAVGFTASGDGDFALARYLADGTPDAAFGGDGTITTDFSAREDHGSGLAIQDDGRYVVAGTTRDPEGRCNIAVARYLGI